MTGRFKDRRELVAENAALAEQLRELRERAWQLWSDYAEAEGRRATREGFDEWFALSQSKGTSDG